MGLNKRTDITILLGLIFSFSLIFLASGDILAFLDLRSFLIVIGGTFGASLVALPKEDIRDTFISIKNHLISPSSLSAKERINKILFLAKLAKKNGTLSIESEAFKEKDPFMRKCIELAVDGVETEEIKRTLEIELIMQEQRASNSVNALKALSTFSPAMGLIGTLIGLIQMLKNLEDSSLIGSSMAIALLTTFYGALLSNLVFLPLSAKLERISKEELLIKELTLQGTLDISTGINPQLVETRLEGFLPLKERTSNF